ncbi:MAG TPA: hypothetical protein VEZ11_12620 [Thermoanaerobaculia bacterium]|nr:hypothetical protein [Thermoanaerobaculia bacterium]
MPIDPYANARAVVLAGALSVAPMAPTPLRQRAPIIVEADRSGVPLILTGTMIIWRGGPRIAIARAEAPMCSDPHHHRHRR